MVATTLTTSDSEVSPPAKAARTQKSEDPKEHVENSKKVAFPERVQVVMVGTTVQEDVVSSTNSSDA